jgi:N-formylglutamate deformylase
MTWLTVTPGPAALIVSLPHSGTDIPADIEAALVSPWLARKDTDWWVEKLYGFASDLGATVLRTSMSRTVIDVNRDPYGASLYPGAATTELCPTTTFDGEPLYSGDPPEASEIARRRDLWFTPYHDAISCEINRLRATHDRVVLYEAHSIRSLAPRLFEGLLPHFNIGTNSGASCAGALARAVETACDATALSRVTDGRFKGGYITRHYGQPARGVHAIQMELACRGYMKEPEKAMTPETWPTPFDPARAAPMSAALRAILNACLTFAGADA